LGVGKGRKGKTNVSSSFENGNQTKFKHRFEFNNQK
jgi:hypothetical protein